MKGRSHQRDSGGLEDGTGYTGLFSPYIPDSAEKLR